MKVAIITDTHFGVRNDSSAMYGNMRLFYDKIFFPNIDKHQVHTVIHAGDYVDRRKYVNFVTAGFIDQTYRAPLRQRKIHEFVITGNHDIYYKDSSKVNALEELYRHDKENVTIVTSPREMALDMCPILLLPWINEENRVQSMDFINNSGCDIVVGHLEISGFDMYRGIPNNEGLNAKLFDRFDLVMSGHYHHQSHRGPIKYLGSPYPMIWSDYNDPRGFHIFDTATKQLEFIENPYSLFARIVYDDKEQDHDYITNICQTIIHPDSIYREAYIKVVVKSKENPAWFDLMIDTLYRAGALEIMVMDDIIVDDDGPVNINDHTTDTRVLIDDYISKLTINCDTNALKKYLHEAYLKAVETSHNARLA
jgi:DNA repair exonuclease SbcCD nuclease subunit